MTRSKLLFVGLIATLARLGAQAEGASAAGLPSTNAEILRLSPEIEQFVDASVRSKNDPGGTLRELINAVFDPDGLGITYGNSRTKSPTETFATRSGNCLSFTMLFVSMARHAGLEARFNEVAQILTWDRRGKFVANNRHMFAEVEFENGRVRVDFLPGENKRYRLVRRISDQRALAHYFNNLGAESLADGAIDRALAHFETARALDDTLGPVWVNQGVARRQAGDFKGAEASYLKALEVDPSETTAAVNLALLYRKLGRAKEAEVYERRVERHRQRNPFHHFGLGVEATERGDNAAAVKHFKGAISRAPDEPDFYVELAGVYARIGQSGKAEQSLVKALKLTSGEAERRTLVERLEQIRAGT